jgi:hypothetical protein
LHPPRSWHRCSVAGVKSSSMRISLPLYRLPALIVATALAAILISWRDTVPMKPAHPSGFTVGTLGPCDLPMPPPDDRDPAIFLRVRGHDDLYYSWGELPGSDHRVGLDQLDKLLSDIFTTRANHALFITFQGGTYEDLIHVIDAFLDVPPRLSPTLPLFCTELDRFGDKLESARVFLLTERSERDMVEHYGRCRVGPMVTELHWFPCWPRPAHQEPLRRPIPAGLSL